MVCVAVLGIGWQGLQWRAAIEGDTARPARLDSQFAGPSQSTVPSILSANLFGGSAVQGSAAAAAAAPREATGLTLRAALTPAGNSKGGAIIEGADGQATWYPVGGSLPSGLTLKEVHRDHVLLDRNGSLEKLEFIPLGDLPAAAASAGVALSGGAGSDSPTSESGHAEPIPANASAEDKARLVRQRLEELRHRSRK